MSARSLSFSLSRLYVHRRREGRFTESDGSKEVRDERNEEQIDTSSLLSSERPIADKRKRGPIRSDTPSVIYAVAGKKRVG